MPTSSGFDRTNYGTTLNFSRYAQQNQQNGGPNYNYHHYPPQAKASQNNPQTRSNPNLSFNTSNENSSNSLQHSNQQKFFTPTTTTQRTGQSYKQHFTAAKQMKAASVGASPNPENSSNGTVENPYNVTIRDPNLRELVQKLVKTNDFNAKKNVMHKGNPDEGTTITKIDHNGYRILFSKNARYPIEEILQQQGFMARTQVPKEHRTTQTETNLKKTREKQREVASYQARTPSPQLVQMVHEAPHTPPTFYDGQSNYEEPPANRYASTGSPASSSSGRSKSETRTMIINESTPINAASLEGVPPEVQKIIEQDLTKNPMASGAERMYRVVINRNLTAANSPDEDPAHVLRVIVKNEGGQNIGHAVSPQQLPQQQPTTTYVQTMTTPQPTTVIQAVPQQQLFNRQKSIVLHYPPPQMTQAPPPTAVAPQPQQVHYILPPIEPVQQQPHRYTPPPHKSVILPSANASSRMSSHAAAEEETAKKPKKRFSFFS